MALRVTRWRCALHDAVARCTVARLHGSLSGHRMEDRRTVRVHTHVTRHSRYTLVSAERVIGEREHVIVEREHVIVERGAWSVERGACD